MKAYKKGTKDYNEIIVYSDCSIIEGIGKLNSPDFPMYRII